MTKADARETSLIFALTVAFGYAVTGVWVGWRFVCLAGLVLLAAVVGWWLLPQLLFLSLGLGGGTALLLGGQWLQRP